MPYLGIDWDAETLEGRLGVLSNREHARLKGCNVGTVRRARQRRTCSECKRVFPLAEAYCSCGWSRKLDSKPTVDDVDTDPDPEPTTLRVPVSISAFEEAVSKPTDEDFEQWVYSAGRPAQAWDDWPVGAFSEIAEVLRRNDGPADDHKPIPVRLMVKRLRDRWKINTNDKILHSLCRALGRQSWSTR